MIESWMGAVGGMGIIALIRFLDGLEEDKKSQKEWEQYVKTYDEKKKQTEEEDKLLLSKYRIKR